MRKDELAGPLRQPYTPERGFGNALNTLESKHVIRERTGHGRNRVFAAEEVIAVLARPFGGESDIALEGARRTLGI